MTVTKTISGYAAQYGDYIALADNRLTAIIECYKLARGNND